MQMATVLLREAAKLASKQAVRRVHLLAEMVKIEARSGEYEPDHYIARLSRDVENCARAAERLRSYNPGGEQGTECPCCWIVDGEHSPLRSGLGEDNLCCDKCKRRYGSDPNIRFVEPRITATASSQVQPPAGLKMTPTAIQRIVRRDSEEPEIGFSDIQDKRFDNASP